MKSPFEIMTVIIGTHVSDVKNYDVLRFNSIVSILNILYNSFVKDGLDSIENIKQENKLKYWDIASKFYDDVPEKIKAAKAAYVLALITSNE